MLAEDRRWARLGCAAGACLIVGAPLAAAQDFGGCGRPIDWREVYPEPGYPRAEVGACLKDKAWDVRHLKIPLRSAASGIVAQCEVDVVFFEGPQGSDARYRAQRELDAVDNEIVQNAAEAVTHYRGCLGS
ncbi:MAG TPA: hypothetical protein VGG68_13440 [Caulobacteraceae bacterium]|jgi:hypothetical protein